MAITGKEIKKNPRLELADNGFVLSYDLYEESAESGYDGMRYVRNTQLVFPTKEKVQAVEAFMKIGKECGKLKESSDDMEDDD